MRTLPLLLTLVFLLPLTAFGQSHPTDRGSLVVDGSANLSAEGNGFDGGRSLHLMINPSVQFFVAPGLALGGSLTLGAFDSDFFGGVGPSATYFFRGSEARSLYPFVSAGLSYLRAFGSDNGAADLSGGAVLTIAKNVGVTGEAFITQGFSNEFSNLGLRFGVSAFVF